MSPEFWERAEQIFEDALALPPEERSEFVRLTAAGDESLCSTVVRMLEGHEQSGMLDEPLAGAPLLSRLFSSSPTFQAGDILSSRFDIQRFLGEGGMGEVYQAFDRELNEVVALKTVRRELAGDGNVLARFKHEVIRARKVTHPNVCRIYDLFNHTLPDQTSLPFFTMEMLDGVTLTQYLAGRPGKKLDDADFAGCMLQVCAGVEAAHRAGILHRDLKSGNIMVISSAQGIRLAITDFGLALNSVARGLSALSHDRGQLAGTLDYMSPEVLSGGVASVASDIYSLGVLMYEAATGQLPFQAASPLLAATIRLARDPKPPRSLAPALPRPFELAIESCLARTPGARPKSAHEIARLLAGSRLGLAARARRIPPNSRRALLAAGFMSAAAAAVFYLVNSRHSRIQPAPHALILLGEIESTADPEAARMLRFLVSMALAESRSLRVIAESRVRNTLQLMSASERPMTGEIARDLGKRLGAGFVVTGTLEPIADGFHMALRATAPHSPTYERNFQQVARSANGFTPAVSRMVLSLLAELSGPEASQAFESHPLENVTTPSLEALQLFSRAFDLYNREGDYDRARDLLRAAARVDPQFAMAYEYQALTYGAQGREDAALGPIERAYQLRERTSPRERQQIEAVYHTCRGDYETTLETYRGLDAEYPEEPSFQRHLAHSYCLLGKPGEGVAFARKAAQMDASVLNLSALSLALTESGHPNEALAEVEQARLSGANSQILAWPEGFAHLVMDQFDRADSCYSVLSSLTNYDRLGKLQLSKCQILRGQIETACEQLENSLALDVAKGDSANEVHRRCWLGQLYRLAGESSSAIKHARSLAANPATPAHLLALHYAASLGFQLKSPRTVRLATGKLGRIYSSYPSTRSQGILEHAAGLQADLEGDSKKSRAHLGRAHSLWPDLMNSQALGRHLLDNGEPAAAVVHFSETLARKGSALRWEMPILWITAHFDVAQAKLAAGDWAGASKACDEFLRFWGSTRPSLQIVVEANTLKHKLARKESSNG